MLTEKKMKKKSHRTESERRGGKSARTGLCAAFVTGFMIVTGLIGTAAGCLASGADLPADPCSLFIKTVQAGTVSAKAAEPYMKITVIDYGSGSSVYGDATLLESGGQYLLIDTGARDPNNTVIKYLKKKGIRNLSLYISHFHEDHCYYAASIIGDSWFKLKKVYLANPDSAKHYLTSYSKNHRRKFYDACKNAVSYYNKILAAARRKKIPVKGLRKGDTFSIGAVNAKVLWDRNQRPVEAFDPYDVTGTGYINNSSLVTKFTFRKRSFLTAGDIECSTERDLLASGADLSADIFKLNHHGIWSANTEAFLRAVNPCYVYYAYKKKGSDPEYRRFGAAADVSATMRKLAPKYNILGNRYNGTITYKVQFNTITVSAERHIKKKSIQVRNDWNGKIRTQTLVYNDAQSLHLDKRMLFSGTKLVTGTAADPSKTYNGWVKDSKGWRYRTKKGKWLAGGWKTIGSSTYYFTNNGYRHEGWLKLNGKMYFMSRVGVRQLGWQMIDGKVYYFLKNGTMATGKTWIGGKVWPLRSNGSLDLSKMKAPGIGILTVEHRHTTK